MHRMMRQVKKYSFLVSYLVALLPLIGFTLGGVYNFLPLIVVFIGIAFVDHYIHDAVNPKAENEKPLSKVPFYKNLLVLYVPLQLALLGYFMVQISQHSFAWYELMGLTLSFGIIVSGGLGITIAHELLHKHDFLQQFCSKILLSVVCYGHFFIEHPRGHHVNVGTHKDPATSRFNESFYRFYPRTLIGSFLSAWHIEKKRLVMLNKSFLNWRNQFWWIILAPLAIVCITYFTLGVGATLFFLAQSILAFSTLELVNYVEHYGLVRKKTQNNRYERVTSKHSWNANNWLSNIIIFHLQRHSDHHARPSIPYQALRHLSESPQLPTGYPGMILIALCPPLWFKIMNPRVEAYQQ